MEEAAGWVAPISTMIAAMMTAANLGSRVTGWGFVIFLIGSICWSMIGLTSGQTNLLWTNGFLTLVNLVGVWRWLGRQAKYEDGGSKAAHASARAHVPTLFSIGSLVGANVSSTDGQPLATIVDAMVNCVGGSIAYLVVSEGGVGGVGERLHVLDPDTLIFCHDGVQTRLTADQLATLPVIESDNWPKNLPRKGA